MNFYKIQNEQHQKTSIRKDFNQMKMAKRNFSKIEKTSYIFMLTWGIKIIKVHLFLYILILAGLFLLMYLIIDNSNTVTVYCYYTVTV